MLKKYFKQKGYGEKAKLNKDFRNYCDNCELLIELVKTTLIKNYVSKGFMHAKCNHVLDIYVFKMNKNIRRAIVQVGASTNWLYPDLLDNLCLFNKDGKCTLAMQSHEYWCQIYGETKQEAELYANLGVEFSQYDEENTFLK